MTSPVALASLLLPTSAPAGERRPVPGRVTVVVVDRPAPGPASLPTAAVLLPGHVRPRRRPVALLDEQARRLDGQLPADWAVVDDASAAYGISCSSDPAHVRLLRSTHPALALLSLLPADAPSGLVVDVLEAGADACLRGAGPDEVDAHLRALHRRRAPVAA